MSTKVTGESAFPTDGDNYGPKCNPGMTLRQYAAIKLKVPDSGEDWLDAMILTALRNDFAEKAINAVVNMGHDELQEFTGEYEENTTIHLVAIASYQTADAMLEARK